MSRFLRGPSVATIAVAKPEPDELLIKVAFVALNPTDWKHVQFALPPAKVIGCEFSGTIVSLGRSVDPKAFGPGDRVAGFVHGCH